MTTPTTPTTVEPGQIWRDNDQRTKGAGEFVVLAVVGLDGKRYGEISDSLRPRVEGAVTTAEKYAHWGWEDMAVVNRGERLSVIRADRLLNGTNTQRGYTYLGMSR